MRRYSILAVLIVLLLAVGMQAQWKSLGPEGGDARALAYDPRNPDRVLLGTSAGQMFESRDAGRTWKPTSHFGKRDDYVLDHIVFDPSDPNTIYVAAWSVEETNGDLFRSTDGGRTWNAIEAMKGKSIRAFTLAEKNPKILVVGALDGVFRSIDRGSHWSKITPDNHPDLRNFESLALDRNDPNIIYAGTWHLPWKTTDGGKNWHNIKTGMIDDSDVFSIIIDRSNPQVVFASACSGIYRSDSAGERFSKVQGIPGSARRTRVLQQDPVNPQIVYAGTTEGLWKTVDGGRTFKRVSPPNFILNDVLIDPRNPSRVLIATDRGGVFLSEDAAGTFRASNTGFSHRQITSVVADGKDASTFYVSVVNDKEFGGVFTSRDGGQVWTQMSAGLGKLDVFDLKQSPDGTLVAATNRGMYRFSPQTRQWEPINSIVTVKSRPAPKAVRVKGKLVKPKPLAPVVTRTTLSRRALGLDLSGNTWLAATDAGLLRSTDRGKTWTGGPVGSESYFVSVAHDGGLAVGAGVRSIAISQDGGQQWELKSAPAYITRIYDVTVVKDNIWLATREGAFRSADQGRTWEHVIGGMPARNVFSIDHTQDGVMVATADANVVYVSRDSGRSWSASQKANHMLRRAITRNGRILAATAYNGLVVSEGSERANNSQWQVGGGN